MNEREQATYDLVWETPVAPFLRRRLKDLYPEIVEPEPPADDKWVSITATAPDERDPRSDAMIGNLGKDDVSTESGRRNWGIPVWEAKSSDPIYKINTNHADADSKAQEAREGIRVPAGARSNYGTDGVLMIVDREAGEVNHFQRSHPGAIDGQRYNYDVDHVKKEIRCWKSFRWSLETGFPFTETAAPTGIPPINPKELLDGHVRHPASMGVDTLTPGPVAPFENSNTDGKGPPGSLHLHMGSVLKIEAAEVARLEDAGAPIWQLAVLRGFRDDGWVVGLNSGSDWSIKYESPMTSDYHDLPATMDYMRGVDRDAIYVVMPFPRP